MKHTERIKRINNALNEHFKTNNDAYWVNNEPYGYPKEITLHRGYGGDRINPIWVALFILRTEKSVSLIDYPYESTNYTRSKLHELGYKI